MAVRGHYGNDGYLWAIIIRRFCDIRSPPCDHTSTTACGRSATTDDWNTESLTALGDWQRDFVVDYLLNQLELAEDDNTKFVELHEDYNFVNWLQDWFGLVSEIQCPEVRLPKTKLSFSQLLRLKPVFQSTLSPKPLRTRWWWCWQYCRAKWVLQKRQYELELVWSGL
jgi:hypothetical protein